MIAALFLLFVLNFVMITRLVYKLEALDKKFVSIELFDNAKLLTMWRDHEIPIDKIENPDSPFGVVRIGHRESNA